jgi:septum formation protein
MKKVAGTYNVVLASGSPRRRELLKGLGIPFTVKVKPVDEVYPPGLQQEGIALFLAGLKAKAFEKNMGPKTLVITADTIVCLGDTVLGKPKNQKDAVQMLKMLSGKMHEVYTGVCLLTAEKKKLFFTVSKVFFKELSSEEINYYVTHYKPYDKAGAYGVQEWLGYIGIEKIEGSYYNVMGLPVKELYEELKKF